MTPPPAAFRLSPVECLLAIALILVAAGCGGDDPAAPQSAAARPAPAKSGGIPRADRGPASGCPQQLDDFVDSLEALRRRLAVGLSYEQYLAEVKSLHASYEAVPVQRLTFDCLATGTPGEKALNKHIDAANTWGECLADAACTTATIEPVLQRKWRIASRHLSEAK